MSDITKEQMGQLNQQYKTFDSIYHNVAVKFGLSDSVFWILYALCESDQEYTQNELCNSWSFPKQTVNSAISNLVKNGYVYLEAVSGTRNRKIVRLTDAGKKFSKQNVKVLMEAEQRAFGRLAAEERKTYLMLAEKHLSFLREETEKQ